jgi:hypothetical protein
MKKITMGEHEKWAFAQVLAFTRDWCSKHQLEVGVLEIALGASAIALGVHNGAIEMGKDLVGSAMSNFNIESGVGGAIGGLSGTGLGQWVGSIGVATGGSAIAVPAVALIGNGALLLGAVGYAAGDAIHNYLHPPIDLRELLTNASLLTVGVALLVDGARRIIKDKRVRAAASYVRDGAVYLCEVAVEIVVRNMRELRGLIRQLVAKPNPVMGAVGGIGTAAILGAGGTNVGSSIAASAMTVLGPHALGATAISLGLVSIPLWPALVSGMVVMGLGYAARRTFRLHSHNSRD